MYWIYCLVTRYPDGTLSAFRNETQAWTLRGLGCRPYIEAWLFEEAIDGGEPAAIQYYFNYDDIRNNRGIDRRSGYNTGGQYYDPLIDEIPDEVKSLVSAPSFRQTDWAYS